MGKIEHTFKDGDVLYANQLNPIVNAVNDNADKIATLANAVTRLKDDGYKFAGVASLEDTPEAPTMSVFKIASVIGTYGGYDLSVGQADGVCAFLYNTGVETPTWEKLQLGIAFPSPAGMITENIQSGIITAQSNHCYKVAEDVETLNITLPAPATGLTDIVKVHCIVGAQPALNISSDNVPVRVNAIFEHHREYIITFFFDGSAWNVSAECLTPGNCLVFQSANSFTLSLNKITIDGTIDFSTNGRDWTRLANNDVNVSSVNNGLRHVIMLRGINTRVSDPDLGGAFIMSMSGSNIQCVGNIMTLLNYIHPEDAVMGAFAFLRLFNTMSALIVAPDMPAKTLTEGCYNMMFTACQNLKYIKMLATDISATNCLTGWVLNVSNSGVFVKSVSMNSLPSGVSGIPAGWTIENG